MIQFRALAAAVATLSILAGEVQAQQGSSPWTELLESRVRVAYRHTHPLTLGDCAARGLPQQAFLVSPDHRRPIGRTWLAGPNQSSWESVVGPASPDTIPVKVLGFTCEGVDPGLLVESNGYYLELDVGQLGRVESNGDIVPGVLLMESSIGGLGHVAFSRTCLDGSCDLSLRDAEADARDVMLQIDARRDEERRMREQFDLRVDAERARRVQDTSTARAGAEALSRQTLAETLSRLGATDEQGRAILQGRVLVGMTPGMVRAAIGEPLEIRQEMRPAGQASVWIYAGRQVEIANGRVSAIR
jgi:hypothetical protein